MKRENFKEQVILLAAEKEFIEQGFHRAKLIAIARRARVIPPVFRTYFKNKNELLRMIFLRKLKVIALTILVYYDKYSLEDAIRKVIEKHFEIMQKSPDTVSFVYNEAILDEKNRVLLLDALTPKLLRLFNRIEEILEIEAEKRTIKPIRAIDLIMNIIALNVFTFMTYPALKTWSASQKTKDVDTLLDERKESNVQFILSALRP